MLARVASNLFWLSRYLQRVENTARLIRVHSNLLMDLPTADPAATWLPLVSITSADQDFIELNIANDESSICTFLINDANNPGSMVNNLEAIRTNLRSSRDCMPTELYELIKDLCSHSIILADQKLQSNAQQQSLKTIEHQSFAIAGAIANAISRDTTYWILQAGRLLERADMTSRILDVRFANLFPVDPNSEQARFENTQWSSVLRTLCARQMYMKHIRKPENSKNIATFLLQNRHFPYAIQYCLIELAQCIQHIGQEHQSSSRHKVNQTDRKAMSQITKLNEVIDTNRDTDIASLASDKQHFHDYMDGLQIAFIQISGDIASRYFPQDDLVGH